MPGLKQPKVVTFKIDQDIWWDFLRICRTHDMSGSQVLRNYVNLIVTKKLRIMDKKVYEHRKAKTPGP
ncbi:hypothetical protein ES703_66358 [subsurface metagenome]